MSSSPETPRFSVRRADWRVDADALQNIRIRVFVEEQAVPEDLEWDSADTQAVHLLALDAASRPIGTARLLDSGQIGRMAVLPEWRGRGVGSALLRAALSIAREAGLSPPYLNAQISAVPFYARMGFVPVGEQFEEAGIPHRRMILSA